MLAMTSTDSYAADTWYSLVQGSLATLRTYSSPNLTSTTLKTASHTGGPSLNALKIITQQYQLTTWKWRRPWDWSDKHRVLQTDNSRHQEEQAPSSRGTSYSRGIAPTTGKACKRAWESRGWIPYSGGLLKGHDRGKGYGQWNKGRRTAALKARDQ